MKRLNVALALAVATSLIPISASAQAPQARPQARPSVANQPDARTQAIIDRAEHLYEMGEQGFAGGDFDRSRRAFDDAIDVILNSGIDIRSNDALHAYYRNLIEKIHKHQIAAHEGEANGFAEQAYVPAESELAKLSDADLAALGNGDTFFDGTYNFQFTAGPAVSQFITYFTQGRGRGTMESGLRRSGRYRAMAERIFREEGVPTDMIWLAQVESVWKPAALSHAAAKGIWQFIPSTGRRFNLDQNYWVDERSDPIKSTRAAARYLKFLHNYFAGDWLLAMAAYNSGEGNVSKAIARSGYADFWEIHRLGFLPTETRNYVPAILAVIIVAHNQKKYGFNVTPEPEWAYDVAQISTQTDLEVVAELCNTSPEYISDLNPHFKRGVTPPGATSLRIPRGRKSNFDTAYAALTPAERLGRQSPQADELASDDSDRKGRDSGFSGSNTTVAYTARPGDSLISLASRYGVTTRELAHVNKLDTDARLKVGQVLRVPAKTGRYADKNVGKSKYKAKSSSSKKTNKSKKSTPKKSTKRSKRRN